MTYIDINNLSYTYPLENKKSIDNMNLKIDKGEILLVIGESGSGKSTLAKCISGAVPHFYGGTIEGTISINGKPINELEHNERAQEITMVFQDPEKQLVMNKVHREIAFGLENIGIEESMIKRRVFESMQFANILPLAYRDIKTLSGGQKQKVAVTSAIAYVPNCIILDEPTSQLDPASAEEIVNLVRKINEELGITIIIIEQRVNKWFDIVDKVSYMKDGKIKLYQNKKDFFLHSSSEEERFFPDYIKLVSSLGIADIPESFKEARILLRDLEFKAEGKNKEAEVTNKSIIESKKLSCSYGGTKVVKDVNLTIKQGEFVAIMGANGAGKSTLLKAMMGLKEYEGSIKIKGTEVKSRGMKQIARTIGYVSQNPNDYISKKTVYDELKFTLDNHGIKGYEEIINETLKDLNIYDLKDKNPRDLSGGQKQRVAIASILVLQPEILLLDEPTRGLDLELKNRLGNTLLKLKDKGTTIIIITHDVDFTCNYCSKFMLMFNGEIVSEGSRENVLTDGIYYTPIVNKLLRHKEASIFTIEQAVRNKI